MPEYTSIALGVTALVIAAELAIFKTGIFRMKTYWIAMGIVVFFQILVDGWLTKLSNPIVIYNERTFSGWRFPFDIPVEDFLFGFSLVTLALIMWIRSEPDS